MHYCCSREYLYFVSKSLQKKVFIVRQRLFNGTGLAHLSPLFNDIVAIKTHHFCALALNARDIREGHGLHPRKDLVGILGPQRLLACHVLIHVWLGLQAQKGQEIIENLLLAQNKVFVANNSESKAVRKVLTVP